LPLSTGAGTFSSPVERGKYLFQKVGCVACHGIDGRGGIPNKNMDIAEEVPSLVYVSDGYTKEELKEVIRKGRYPARASATDPAPPLWMPAWEGKISEEEIDAIADYLIGLHPGA
jgi:mono/diheme cytochrome c family protein